MKGMHLIRTPRYLQGDESWNLLIYFARWGNLSIVEALLPHVDISSDEIDAAIATSRWNGHADIVELLNECINE